MADWFDKINTQDCFTHNASARVLLLSGEHSPDDKPYSGVFFKRHDHFSGDYAVCD